MSECLHASTDSSSFRTHFGIFWEDFWHERGKKIQEFPATFTWDDDEFDDFITKVWHDTSKIYHNYRDMQSSSAFSTIRKTTWIHDLENGKMKLCHLLVLGRATLKMSSNSVFWERVIWSSRPYHYWFCLWKVSSDQTLTRKHLLNHKIGALKYVVSFFISHSVWKSQKSLI